MNKLACALLLSGASLLCMPSISAAQSLPEYYPADYTSITDAAENDLVIYSSMAPNNWAPVIEGFNQLYPGISVQTVELGNELYERYRAESASGVRSADLIVTAGGDNWEQFVQTGQLMPYKSVEADHLPEWAAETDGLYAVTSDPMLIVYNKFLVQEPPTSIKDIVALETEQPELQGRVTTYNVSGPYAMSLNYTFIRHAPENIEALRAIGPTAKLERSAGPMFEKVATGEYALGYFVSSTTVFTRMKDPALASIVGWSYIQDGTPVIPRGVGIPANATSPNAAKLMLDFLVSQAGQTALAVGGLTPVREDVPNPDGTLHTYAKMAEGAGGEQNLAILGFESMQDFDAFKQTLRDIYPNSN
ncbi:extracellular solute-binding protein [Cereibacter sp. SYSU M97828]|nr:extracellular solute-binding protein [Cereibacter flavus]